MRETENFYFFLKHQFGQWTQRDMISPDGITYNCCEQYMMYNKALLFNDNKIAEKILEEKNPANQQKLGREIKGYKKSKWDKHKVGIVWYGNYLKFTQHSDLKERLIATDCKVLAEASPIDLVWGIGFSANDDRILNEENWRGENLLGEVLMSIRSVVKLV